MIPLHPPALSGDGVYRIHWVLGTDRLLAVCHCGAQREFEDPVVLWDWLLGHPEDHHLGSVPESAPAPAPALAPAPQPRQADFA
ncbi:hypothetical protein ACFQ7F_16260 [Streptomyces sp. NPDC056486]|uniref:hypothetical protein n=1 Tax=Streptomyces sp. NPDC056486 TaxID=3345835 RepID=UPI003693D7A8